MHLNGSDDWWDKYDVLPRNEHDLRSVIVWGHRSADHAYVFSHSSLYQPSNFLFYRRKRCLWFRSCVDHNGNLAIFLRPRSVDRRDS